MGNSRPGLSRWREKAERASREGERRSRVGRHLFGLKNCSIQIPLCLVSLLKVGCSCPKTSLGKYFSDFPTPRGPQDLPGPLPGTSATPSVHGPDAALLPHLPFPMPWIPPLPAELPANPAQGSSRWRHRLLEVAWNLAVMMVRQICVNSVEAWEKLNSL